MQRYICHSITLYIYIYIYRHPNTLFIYLFYENANTLIWRWKNESYRATNVWSYGLLMNILMCLRFRHSWKYKKVRSLLRRKRIFHIYFLIFWPYICDHQSEYEYYFYYCFLWFAIFFFNSDIKNVFVMIRKNIFGD